MAQSSTKVGEAAYHGRIEIAKSLISFGAAVNCENNVGYPSHVGSRKGKGGYGSPPRTALVASGNGMKVEIAEMLLARTLSVERIGKVIDRASAEELTKIVEGSNEIIA